jgi:uncharacterized protein
MSMAELDATTLANLQRALRTGPRLRLAVLFGSFARGRGRSDSDLDLAILPVDPSLPLRDELDLQVALEHAAAREVDLVRLDRAPIVLRWRIAREGVPLVGTESREWTRFLAETAAEHAEIAPALARAAEIFRRRLTQQPSP